MTVLLESIDRLLLNCSSFFSIQVIIQVTESKPSGQCLWSSFIHMRQQGYAREPYTSRTPIYARISMHTCGSTT